MIDSPEAIKILIDAGFDIDTRDLAGYTTLMKTRSPEVAQLLIDAGADINAKRITFTPVHQSTDTVLMITESADIVRLLVKAGANIDAQNTIGYTALMTSESLEKIKALIDCGADTSIRNQFGYDAFETFEYLLHHIVTDEISRYLEHVQLMLAAKTDASVNDGDSVNNRQRL